MKFSLREISVFMRYSKTHSVKFNRDVGITKPMVFMFLRMSAYMSAQQNQSVHFPSRDVSIHAEQQKTTVFIFILMSVYMSIKQEPQCAFPPRDVSIYVSA